MSNPTISSSFLTRRPKVASITLAMTQVTPNE